MILNRDLCRKLTEMLHLVVRKWEKSFSPEKEGPTRDFLPFIQVRKIPFLSRIVVFIVKMTIILSTKIRLVK